MGYSPRRGYKESASTLHIQLECYFIYIDGEEGIGCIVGDLLSWPKSSFRFPYNVTEKPE